MSAPVSSNSAALQQIRRFAIPSSALTMGTYTMAAFERIRVDVTTGGTPVISAPPTPALGDQFGVKCISDTIGNTFTVSGNGKSVEDPFSAGFSLVATTSAIPGKGCAFTWEYDGTQWLLVGLVQNNGAR